MSILLSNLKTILTISGLLIIKGPPKLLSVTFSTLKALAILSAVNVLDLTTFVANCLTPRRRKGAVVKKGVPGYKGIWPQYVKPNPEVDSRGPCPYINALANHGIINRSGRNISSKELRDAIVGSLNTSYTLTLNTTNGMEQLIGKSVIDLADLSKHDAIEHDCSALRADTYFQPDQGIPNKEIITTLLSYASRPPSAEHPEGALSAADIARFTNARIADSKKRNPMFNGLSAFHTLFMGNNLSLLLDTTDGDVRVSKTILMEERFPDGFETSFRHRWGYTNLEMELRSAEILLRMTGVSI